MVWLVNKKGKRIEFDDLSEQDKIKFHINEMGFEYEHITENTQDDEMIINPLSRKHLAIFDHGFDDYAGGSYHAYMITKAVAEVFHYTDWNVTYYTPQKNKLYQDFDFYCKFKTEMVNSILTIDVKADAYFGHTREGAMQAMKLAKKYKKPCFILLNDSLTRVKEYTPDEYDEEAEYIKPLTDILKDTKGVKILTVSKDTAENSLKWLNRKRSEFCVCEPAVNSRVLATVNDYDLRKKWVAVVGRVVERKNYEDNFRAFVALPKDWRLQIITSHWYRGDVQRLAKKYKCESRIDAHYSVNDYEKFKILKQCSMMINSSNFEGFGMWAIESASCGLPLVCYDLPTLKEICAGNKRKDLYYFAKFGDSKGFIQKVTEVAEMTDKSIWNADHTYCYDRLVWRVREAFAELLYDK